MAGKQRASAVHRGVTCVETSKSAILTWPDDVRRMLDGFTSGDGRLDAGKSNGQRAKGELRDESRYCKTIKQEGVRREYGGSTEGIRREYGGSTEGIRTTVNDLLAVEIFQALQHLLRNESYFTLRKRVPLCGDLLQ
jgi:hypothetical protein